MHILALLAHPDDVECNCAGTLLKYKQAGHKIFIALTTSGNTGSNEIESREEIQNIREAEQLEAAKTLDAQVRFMRFEDESLFDTPETREAVLTAIRWADPDVIFTHHPGDYSTDHNMTSKLVTEVLSGAGDDLQSAKPLPERKKPQVFFCNGTTALVDITEQIDTKIEMLRKHKSQAGWMATFLPEDDFVEQIKAIDHMKGMWGSYRYAEGFDAYQVPGYCADYRVLP